MCRRYYYQKRTGKKHESVLIISEKYIIEQIIICHDPIRVGKNGKKT
jgi:hypothetical protein